MSAAVVLDVAVVEVRGERGPVGVELPTATIWCGGERLASVLPGVIGIARGDGFYDTDVAPVRHLGFNARFLVPIAPRVTLDLTVAVRDGRRSTTAEPNDALAPTVMVGGALVDVLEVMHGLTPSLSSDATFDGDMVALAMYLGWLSGSHAYRRLFPHRELIRAAFCDL